jgi:hypothetical protein
MSLGMNVGLTELRKYAAPTLVSRMVLLTDGVTYGDADRCRRIADDAGASGVGIYPLGIGADWDEDLLDNIGQRSSGMPAEFIRRPDDALNLFSAQLQSAAAVAVGPSKDYWWGIFSEFGTAHESARAFMRPAYDSTVDVSMGLITEEIWIRLRETAETGSFTPSAASGGGLL